MFPSVSPGDLAVSFILPDVRLGDFRYKRVFNIRRGQETTNGRQDGSQTTFGREPRRAGWVDMSLGHELFEIGITPPVLVVGADIAEAVNVGMVNSGKELKNWWP